MPLVFILTQDENRYDTFCISIDSVFFLKNQYSKT